jgi:hypothetical protein
MFRPLSAELQQYLHLSSSVLYIAALPDVSRNYRPKHVVVHVMNECTCIYFIYSAVLIGKSIDEHWWKWLILRCCGRCVDTTSRCGVRLCILYNVNACPSFCVFHLENGSTNFDQIWPCRSNFNFRLGRTRWTVRLNEKLLHVCASSHHYSADAQFMSLRTYPLLVK